MKHLGNAIDTSSRVANVLSVLPADVLNCIMLHEALAMAPGV